MAEITMPRLSDTMEDGLVVRWLKSIGEAVSRGEVVAEIETDKATMEMESLEDGVLSEIHVEEGQRVSVGQPMAVIDAGGQPSRSAAVAAAIASPESVGSTARAAPSQRVKASPRARKAAREMNLELAGVEGSGPSGRILHRDVMAAAGAGASSDHPSAAASRRVPLSSMRQRIAERMVDSKTRIPHFYLQVEIDAEPLLELRGQVNSALEEWGGSRLSLNDLVLKAAATALTRAPPAQCFLHPGGAFFAMARCTWGLRSAWRKGC